MLNNLINDRKRGKMALKTFNIDAEVYKEFSDYCKGEGISMSKKVERFIRDEVERLNPKKVERKTEKNLVKISELKSYIH